MTAVGATVGRFLAIHTAGLVPQPVGAAWWTAEQGGGNNPYGVTVGGHLATYPTLEAGVSAAAALLLGAPAYAATRAALIAARGDLNAAATAIAQSPWHLGPAGLRAAGGTDPYYARVFRAAGFHVPPTSGGSVVSKIILARLHVEKGTPFAAVPAGPPLGTYSDGYDITQVAQTDDATWAAVITRTNDVLRLVWIATAVSSPAVSPPPAGWADAALTALRSGTLPGAQAIAPVSMAAPGVTPFAGAFAPAYAAALAIPNDAGPDANLTANEYAVLVDGQALNLDWVAESRGWMEATIGFTGYLSQLFNRLGFLVNAYQPISSGNGPEVGNPSLLSAIGIIQAEINRVELMGNTTGLPPTSRALDPVAFLPALVHGEGAYVTGTADIQATLLAAGIGAVPVPNYAWRTAQGPIVFAQ